MEANLELKTLSIADLKAIIDYCHNERTAYITYSKVIKPEYEEKLSKIKRSAESELSLRLGIKE